MGVVNVVCWKWRPVPGYRSAFGPETVNVLRRMVGRHYGREHDFICVTDDPSGIDPGIKIVPLWSQWADIPSPHGGRQPSCYRRLLAFAPEARDWFGDRFISMDLDTVIVDDLCPIIDRPEDFICWGDTDKRSWYNGSMWMMTAGSRRQVLDLFDPKTSPRLARAAGKFGSDQAHISYVLGPDEAKWDKQDGVYSFRVHLKNGALPLPKNAKVVCFHGHQDPWGPLAQRLDWVKRCYR